MPHIYPEDCSSARACGRTWQDGSHPIHPWELAVCLRLAFRKGLTLEVPCAWGVELAAVFSVKPGWFSDVLDSGCCNPWIKGLRYLASTRRVWEAHIQYRSWICPGCSRSCCWWDPPQRWGLCGLTTGWWLRAQGLRVSGGLAGDDMSSATKGGCYPMV